MTNKISDKIGQLKCPFCGTKLIQIQDMDFYFCGNLCCQLSESLKAPASIWQDLIDGKKAQDALNRAKQKLDLIAFHSGEDCHIARELRTIAKDSLDEITSITKQGNE